MSAAVRRLHAAMARNNELTAQLDSPDFPIASLCLLQDWQRQRLQRSFADLAANPRYRAANDFFLTELYGGLNFRERDREVERVMPVMTRTMPLGNMTRMTMDERDSIARWYAGRLKNK